MTVKLLFEPKSIQCEFETCFRRADYAPAVATSIYVCEKHRNVFHPSVHDRWKRIVR